MNEPTASDRRIAGALVLAEKDAHDAVTQTVRRASADLADRIAAARSVAAAQKALRRVLDDVTDDAEDDLVTARETARVGARKRHLEALLLLLGRSSGVSPADRESVRSAVTALPLAGLAEDLVRARVAAQALANQWAQAALRALSPSPASAKIPSKAEQAIPMPPGGNPYRTAAPRADIEHVLRRDLPKAVGPAVDRAVVTEVATAHNDEARRVYDALPLEMRHRFDVEWSAILDRRTCDRCEALDGKIIVSDWPPAHPSCRCTAVPRFR